MVDPRAHIDEALQEWLDGRLAPAERQAVEAHLRGCSRCQRIRVSLEQARHALRALNADAADAADAAEGSPALRAGILAALDAEDRPFAAVPGPGRRSRLPALGWAAAAAVLIAAVLWLGLPALLEQRTADPVAAVAAEHHRLAADELKIEHAAADAAELERYFAARGLPFRPRVLDLAMMGWELVGGRVGQIGREPSAVMAYRRIGASGVDSDLLLCQMYRGRLGDLPAAAEVQQRGAFTFHVFQRGAATIVFWQEGELICVLIGSGDRAALLDLAAAKAMLAPRAVSML